MPVVGIRADAAADRQVDLQVAEDERRLERRVEPLDETHRFLLGRDVHEQDRELIVADARNGCAAVDQPAHSARDQTQYFVAVAGAVEIVDFLKAVDVDGDERDAAAVTLRHRDGLHHAVLEQRTVRKVRQRIVLREIRQPLLGDLALGDVEGDRDGADDAAVDVAQRLDVAAERLAGPDHLVLGRPALQRLQVRVPDRESAIRRPAAANWRRDCR